MTAEPDGRPTEYPYRRFDTIHESSSNNEKRNSHDIANRRHSLAHANFRKAIYRSLSLPQGNDESNHLSIRFIRYFIQFIFLCLFILLFGFLIKLMWSSQRQK